MEFLRCSSRHSGYQNLRVLLNLLSVFTAEQCCLRTIKPNDSCQKCWHFFGPWEPGSTSCVGWHLESVITCSASAPLFLQFSAARAIYPHSRPGLPRALELTSFFIGGEKKKSWDTQPCCGSHGDLSSSPRASLPLVSCSSFYRVILLLNLSQTSTFSHLTFLLSAAEAP